MLDAFDVLVMERRSLIYAAGGLGGAGWPLARILDLADTAMRAVADRDAEIARLHAEISVLHQTPTEYCLARDADAIMADAGGQREDGTVLRCTDRALAWAWRAARRTWEPVT